MKAPSNRVGVTLITVASLVTIIIVVSNIKDRFIKTEKIPEKQLSVEIKTEKNSIDSDGDGLTDWEETLWKTDPNNPDSDRDGTKDGEEIALNRNPKIAGPDDTIATIEELASKYEPQETDNNSLTSNIARNLFTNFINIKNSEGINKENSQELAQQLVLEANNQITLKDYYSPDNLITFDSKDKEALKNYGNKLIETTILNMENIVKNPESDSNLSFFAQGYKNLARNLSMIPVPKELKNQHANYVNNFYKLSLIIESFDQSNSDPFLSLVLIPKFEEVAKNQTLSTEQIANFLKENGIIYLNDEYGSLLYKQGQNYDI